jgi:hypothetical protein
MENVQDTLNSDNRKNMKKNIEKLRHQPGDIPKSEIICNSAGEFTVSSLKEIVQNKGGQDGPSIV